jgi:hypothetical protein
VTCDQPLPEGKEPEYFASTSEGYTPETETERAAEDVSQGLRYAETVNSAVWDMLQVAGVNPRELLDKDHYLDHARSLCFLLTDLVDEVTRRVKRLRCSVDERQEREQAQQPDGTYKVRKEG